MPASVALGFIHANSVATGFMTGSLALVAQRRLAGVIAERGSPVSLGAARDTVVARFLETEAEYLWFVDTDIVFDSSALDRLLEHGAPIVSGNYSLALESPVNYKWRAQPCAFRIDGSDMLPFDEYKGLMSVDVVGAGCLLVHRNVFLSMNDWFAEIPPEGEDVVFCKRAARAGHEILFDADCKVMHQKTVWV